MLALLKRFWTEEYAVGTVEIILILVVLIIFKQQLTSIVNSIFSKISSQSSQI